MKKSTVVRAISLGVSALVLTAVGATTASATTVQPAGSKECPVCVVGS